MDLRRARLPWGFGSGAAVGDLFGRVFALVSLGAWLSLGVQVHVLLGSRGLLPVGDLVAAARAQGVASPIELPTLFLWTQSDRALAAGAAAGVMLSLAAFFSRGVPRRVCFALSTLLYLSYATASRLFLSFQWDNLLLECGVLAAFLPSGRPAPVVHFLFRVVLFKLYFESGIAKWQSGLHDWQDGSAMTYYYETAPLPTFLAWYAHNLPAAWHHFESRATLALELAVPFGIFGPRRVRLAAAAVLTAFQIANAATANYGFFCYLAGALGLFLLDDGDVERARARLRRLLPARLLRRRLRLRPEEQARPPRPARGAGVARAATAVGTGAFLIVSLAEGLLAFAGAEWLPRPVLTVVGWNQTFRLVGTYHLFASITRERVEPELQTLPAGAADDDEGAWAPHHLWHKPGDVRRAPDFVAPHQPRVDFQLWFYGLRFGYRMPPYVSTLVERMCEDSRAVQALFRDPLPAQPRAVRLVYWQYHFTTTAERRASGAWWRRERVGATRPIPCPAAEAR